MNAVCLLEPSFAAAIAAIKGAPELSSSIKAQWTCSLRVIGRALERSLTLIPSRWTAVRMPVDRLHHETLGIQRHTLANHRSNLKAALRFMTGERSGPIRGAPLTPPWSHLAQLIEDRGARARLYGFMRYASGKAVPPVQVTETLLDDYMQYREQTTSLAFSPSARRKIARE